MQHHDLLWPADPNVKPPTAVLAGMAPEAGALYRAVVEAAQPCAAAELAIRLQLPYAVVAVMATELVEAGLVCRADTVAKPSGEVAQRVLRGVRPVVFETVKIVVAGAPGSGKSALTGALSDTAPARYEELVPAHRPDHHNGEPQPGRDRTWDVVVRDVGWAALPDGLVLMLASHPGRSGCDFMWDDVARNAAGAIVLVDPKHVPEAAPHVTAVEQRRLPFVLALNPLSAQAVPEPEVETIRDLLDVASDIPVVAVDARSRAQAREVVGALIRHVAASCATVPVSTDLTAQDHPEAQEADQ